VIYAVSRSPAHILFGRGARAAITAVVRGIGNSALICSDSAVLAQPAAMEIIDALRGAGVAVTVFEDTQPELPLACVEQAIAASLAMPRLDVVIGLGGGSALDLAKLVALGRTHDGPLARFYGECLVPGPCLPVVAVPTTAGTGSEVTPVAVVDDPARGIKVGISSPFMVPTAAICDPELTLSCPTRITAFSGIDALAHAVEAFTAKRRAPEFESYPAEVFQGKNALSDVSALEAVRRISVSLERAVTDGSDIEARESMLFGSLCAGLAFAAAGTAGAHALQYAVGAATHTPHGLGVGLLLPYVLSFTQPTCEPELRALGLALGIAEDYGDAAHAAIEEIRRLALAVGVPATLKELGVSRADLPRLAHEASAVTRLLRNSPTVLDDEALLRILEASHEGELVGRREASETVS
jgi:alcohol dehydrogenase